MTAANAKNPHKTSIGNVANGLFARDSSVLESDIEFWTLVGHQNAGSQHEPSGRYTLLRSHLFQKAYLRRSPMAALAGCETAARIAKWPGSRTGSGNDKSRGSQVPRLFYINVSWGGFQNEQVCCMATRISSSAPAATSCLGGFMEHSKCCRGKCSICQNTQVTCKGKHAGPGPWASRSVGFSSAVRHHCFI
jgi:hypothetical protein